MRVFALLLLLPFAVVAADPAPELLTVAPKPVVYQTVYYQSVQYRTGPLGLFRWRVSAPVVYTAPATTYVIHPAAQVMPAQSCPNGRCPNAR